MKKNYSPEKKIPDSKPVAFNNYEGLEREQDARWGFKGGFWLQSLFGSGNQADKEKAEESRKKLPYQLHHHTGKKNDPTQTQKPHSSPSLSQNSSMNVSSHPSQHPFGGDKIRDRELRGFIKRPTSPKSLLFFKSKYVQEMLQEIYSRQLSLSSDLTCESADNLDFIYKLSNVQEINFATSAISNSIDDYGAVDFGVEDFQATDKVRVVNVWNSTDDILRIVIHHKYGDDWITSDWVRVFPNCKEILCTTDCNFVYVHGETDKEVWEDDDYVFNVEGHNINFFRHNFNTQKSDGGPTHTIEFNPGSGVPCYQAYRIWLVNESLSVLKVAISYRQLGSEEGEWKDMCWLFDPGEEGILVDTTHPVLFVFAETDSHIWEGQVTRMHEIVGEREFYRQHVAVDSFCRVKLKLNPEMKKLKAHKTDIDFRDDYSVGSFASNQYKDSSVYSFGGNSFCTGVSESMGGLSMGGSSVFDAHDHELSEFFDQHDMKEPMVVSALFEMNQDDDDEEGKIVQSGLSEMSLSMSDGISSISSHTSHKQKYSNIDLPSYRNQSYGDGFSSSTNENSTSSKHNDPTHHMSPEYIFNPHFDHNHTAPPNQTTHHQNQKNSSSPNQLIYNPTLGQYVPELQTRQQLQQFNQNKMSYSLHQEQNQSNQISPGQHHLNTSALHQHNQVHLQHPSQNNNSHKNITSSSPPTRSHINKKTDPPYLFYPGVISDSETYSTVSNLSKTSFKKEPYRQPEPDQNDGFGPVRFKNVNPPLRPESEEIVFHGKNNNKSLPVSFSDFQNQDSSDGYTTITAVDGTKICTVYE